MISVDYQLGLSLKFKKKQWMRSELSRSSNQINSWNFAFHNTFKFISSFFFDKFTRVIKKEASEKLWFFLIQQQSAVSIDGHEIFQIVWMNQLGFCPNQCIDKVYNEQAVSTQIQWLLHDDDFIVFSINNRISVLLILIFVIFNFNSQMLSL